MQSVINTPEYSQTFFWEFGETQCNRTFLLFKKVVLKSELFNGWELSKNAAPFIDLYFYVLLTR